MMDFWSDLSIHFASSFIQGHNSLSKISSPKWTFQSVAYEAYGAYVSGRKAKFARYPELRFFGCSLLVQYFQYAN
jgi:hypothetical protein